MPEMREAALRNLPPAQAAELALLVELEARWENLRKTPARAQEAGAVAQDLRRVQQAYEAFHSKLAGYNKRYTPAHVPELLLNTPPRLALWCRAMRDLFLGLEHDPRAPCPVHLLEKAYRWAERVSARLNKDPVSRPAPPGTIRAAAEELGALALWCDGLAAVTATA